MRHPGPLPYPPLAPTVMRIPTDERRSEPRLSGAFASRVRFGAGAATKALDAVVEDLSTRALRLRAPVCVVTPGDRVLALVRWAVVHASGGAHVAVRGRVMRVDARPGGSTAVTVVVEQRRWMYARDGGASDRLEHQNTGASSARTS